MALRKYSKAEPLIFLWLMLPFVIGINAIIFGSCVFTSFRIFISSFALSACFLFFSYLCFRGVAFLIRDRFPSNGDLFRRIAVMLPVFMFMNILMITGLYALHNIFPVVSCALIVSNVWWAFLFATISSTVITLLNEAVVNWNSWKRSITETEQLKNAYKKTKLLGLKGQVNPHFLFNCFNSLSSLISENEDAAEKFLNEMTKVHRYMLRSDEELLVTLEEELKFASSYLYLIKARFGNAIAANIEIPESRRKYHLPPLSLHVILENIIYSNSASNEAPLKIDILTTDENYLTITNSVHPRIRKDIIDYEEGLDNLLNKYRLLEENKVVISENEHQRIISLPLIQEKEIIL